MSQGNPMIQKLAEESTLGRMLENRARELPEHPAIMYHGTTLTFAELDDTVNRLATDLLNRGVTKQDRIALILPTRPEYLYVWFAASKIGCSVVGLNFRYKEDEVVYMVNESKPRFLVCINSFAETDYSEFVANVKDRCPSLETFIFVGATDFPGAVAFDDLVAGRADPEAIEKAQAKVKPEEDNLIIFTSGSTGKPKGAVLTQKSIMAMLRPWARNLDFAPDDRALDVLPLNHVGGGTLLAMGPLSSGVTLVLHDVFDPASVLDMIQDLGVTVFGGVPTVYALFFSLPNFDKTKLSSLNLMAYGGSAATPELLKKMDENTDATIMACYGSTEVSGFCTYTRRDDPVQKILDNSVGRPPEEVDLSIVDPNNRKSLSQGEVGEVAVRGDLLIDRYLNAPETTAKSFDQDGWFYTGDMGYLDEDGFLFLVGRYKEMYICGGFNVYPPEIEDVIVQHPNVSMAAVIGVPHEKMGEVGWAYVMKRPGTELDPEELRQMCAKRLADYKVPAQVIVRDILPMTALGKIHKPTLAEEAKKEMS